MPATYEALGYRFVVRVTGATPRTAVEQFLAGFLEDGAPPTTNADDLPVLDLPDLDMSPNGAVALIGTLNLRAMGHAEGSLLVHGGAVCDDTGSVTMLIGPSGSGKSTLTTALVSRGHRYVTDETVCISPETLRITPFRKPISLKVGSQSVFPQLRPAAGSLGDGADDQWLIPPVEVERERGPLPRPLTPALIVFPTYQAGSDTRVETLTVGRAAYELGTNASFVWSVRGGLLPVLGRVARQTPAFRLTFGDSESAADAVERLMAGMP